MAEPSYRIEVQERPGFLHVVINGDKDSYETTLGAVTEVASICRSRCATKLLLEHRIPGRLSTLEIYKLGTQLPELYFGICVAFVVHLAAEPDNPKFIENVARNQGGSGRMFFNAKDAEAWLASLP